MIGLALLATLTSAALAAEPAPAFAGEPQGFGLGVVFGAPSGISLIRRNDDRGAIQGSIGWNLVDDRLAVSADYLLNVVILDGPELPNVRFPLYVGIGGIAAVYDGSAYVGARIPLGITVLPRKVRMDAFLEIVPVVDLIPASGVSGEAGIGARYYF